MPASRVRSELNGDEKLKMEEAEKRIGQNFSQLSQTSPRLEKHKLGYFCFALRNIAIYTRLYTTVVLPLQRFVSTPNFSASLNSLLESLHNLIRFLRSEQCSTSNDHIRTCPISPQISSDSNPTRRRKEFFLPARAQHPTVPGPTPPST